MGARARPPRRSGAIRRCSATSRRCFIFRGGTWRCGCASVVDRSAGQLFLIHAWRRCSWAGEPACWRWWRWPAALMLTYSTQARPYSLALAACLATLWGVARWLETGSRRHGLAVFGRVRARGPPAFPVRPLCGRSGFSRLAPPTRQAAGALAAARTVGRLVGALLMPLFPLLGRLSRFPPSALGIPSLADLTELLDPVTVMLSLVAFASLLVAADTAARPRWTADAPRPVRRSPGVVLFSRAAPAPVRRFAPDSHDDSHRSFRATHRRRAGADGRGAVLRLLAHPWHAGAARLLSALPVLCGIQSSSRRPTGPSAGGTRSKRSAR